jgi:hypothetical protein
MRQPQPGVGGPGFIRILTGLVLAIALAACGGSSRSDSVNEPNKIIAAVRHGTPLWPEVLLEEASCDEWIVGCADPEAVIAGLSLPSRAR